MKYLLFLLLLIPSLIKGQDSARNSIDSAVILKTHQGVYRNIMEFISDNPGLQLNYSIKNRSQSEIVMWGGSDYDVKFSRGIKKSFIKDSIWGINTGEVILINNNLIGTNRGFVRLLKVDYPYSYFTSNILARDESEEYAMYMGGAIFGAVSGIPYKRIVAIDMRTGAMIRLNDYGMTLLLQKDKDLLEKYKALDNRNDKEVVIEFLELVNKRY
jgi:hypothetical protein